MKEIELEYIKDRKQKRFNRRFISSSGPSRYIPAYKNILILNENKLKLLLKEFYETNAGINSILLDPKNENSGIDIPERIKVIKDSSKFINRITSLISKHCTKRKIRTVYLE